MELLRTKSMINCEKRNGGFCLNFYQQINTTTRFSQGIQISADHCQQSIGLQGAIRFQPVSISVSDLSSWRKRARGRSVRCFTPVTYTRSDGRQRRVGRNKALPVHAHRQVQIHRLGTHSLVPHAVRHRHTQNTCMRNSNAFSCLHCYVGTDILCKLWAR